MDIEEMNQWIDSLIETCGWKFIVSHDVNGQAVPDMWIQEDTQDVCADKEEVLQWILQYISNYRACGL